MQRIGRAGHQVGAPSRGRIFPKYRGDLLDAPPWWSGCSAARSRRPASPGCRSTCWRSSWWPSARTAPGPWTTLERLVRGAYPFAELSREQLEGVLDMLAGRYPSDAFAELRPRVIWDRTAGTVRGRDGSRAAGRQNAGTIPDRGLFTASCCPTARGSASWTRRWSTRPAAGQAFMLGASTWRIEEITRDRVVVTPAPGAPGALPFWKGEGIGRPYELGEGVGRLARELIAAGPREATRRLRARERLRRACGGQPGRIPRGAGGAPPAPCPATAPSWSSASATRSATGGCAC